MGKCSSLIRTLKHQDDKALIEGKPTTEDLKGRNNPIMMRKIQLINNWQSYELETVIQKIMTMCEYQKKNHMNFTLFLEFFPNLKRMSMKTQLRYFDLFDFTKSSYINIREIIFGITQIYFTPRAQYSEILKEIYKRSKGDFLTNSQLKLFLSQNKNQIDEALKSDKNYEKNLSGKQPIQESSFDLMVAKYFDIRKYQQTFDFYNTKLQTQILDSLKTYKNDDDNVSHSRKSVKIRSRNDDKTQERKEEKKAETYEIRINRGDKVFLIEKNWFQSWVKYMAIHSCYQIIYEIQNAKDTFFQRKSFSFDEVFMENAKLTRPSRIYNYDLLSEYETDLKPSLRIFQDFIPLPQKMWKSLVTIYKGGPEIERVYPHLFDTVVINKVTVDGKAKFLESKVIKCIVQPGQAISQMLKNQSRLGVIFFKRVPSCVNRQNLSISDLQSLSKWQQLNRNTQVDDSMHQGFICVVPEGLKTLFQTNYKSFGPPPVSDINVVQTSLLQKQNRLSYGEIINFKTHTYYDAENNNKSEHLLLSAYVTDIRKNDVRLHFVGTSDTCDDYYSVDELVEGINNKIIVSNKNIITTFEGLQNHSEVNAVLQVLIASPFFSDYFLKQKHIRSLSSDTNLQSCLSSYFSKVIYDVKKHQKQTVKPDDLYKKISSKIYQLNSDSSTKHYAQKFISKFLEVLSSELGNPQKLFDKYSLVMNTGQNKDEKFKGSIIEAFFKLSESTKSICSTCKSEYIHTNQSYTLKVPLPEDEQVCYKVIYCPVSCKNFVRYAITIRKSQKFIKYVHKFADQIKIDPSRICFAEVKNNEFRKHYTQYDYESSLFNLDLNPTDSIYVFELRNHRFNKDIDDNDQEFHDKFLKLNIGDIIDFNMYTEWHVGKILNFNKQKIVIQNFQGVSEVEKKKIDNFKTKTEEKGWYQIDLLHRRINSDKQDRIDYFLTPSILTIAQWMEWGEVFSVVKNYVRNYFDLQYNKVFEDRAVSNDLFLKIFQFLGNAPDIIENSKREKSQSCIFSQPDDIDKKSDSPNRTETDTPSFVIKIFLKNSGQICAICHKKSIFQKQSSYIDNKYCYGCSINLNDQEPIAIKVNPAKISIVLDWVPLDVDPLIGKVFEKTEEHPTYHSVTTKIKNQINTIDDCFQLYIETNKKIEIDCDKCGGRNLGEQTRYLSESPNMLIIHLNRFKTSKNMQYKLDNKIQVKRQLTIERIQMESKKEDIYELYGIICHRQISQTSEKWYSCVLKSRNIWVKCEDTKATLIDFNKIDKEQIYMLMYRKKNIKCTILSMIF